MKAMILAAGLGTRLKPRTDSLPKALVRAGNMTLLERLIHKLRVQGFTDIVINVHHHADQVTDYLSAKDNFGVNITVSDERSMLLDTGGGIFHAREQLGDDPFIVHNVDILSDIDLRKVYQEHITNQAMATLVVKRRKTSRYLLFDHNMLMQGWENRYTGERIIFAGPEEALTPLAFSGIHVISPEIFSLYPREGSFSIIEAYLDLCKEQSIKAYPHDKGLWIDAGKPNGLKLANTLLGNL
jgi:NDP-sugar pyrophosphorylase family protein